MNVEVPRILVVDDEEDITFLLDTALRHAGYDVRVARAGRAGLAQVDSFAPDVVLLDIMMPELDGFETLRRLRLQGGRMPVLLMSAQDGTEDKVRGLTLGGDDYLVKPFNVEELLARVGAMLRRRESDATVRTLIFADVVMDDDAHIVRRAGQRIDLSITEYNLLRFLLQNPGRVLHRNVIRDRVWQYDFDGRATVVETYISYLRKKVDRSGPPLIHTVRGVGYALRLTA